VDRIATARKAIAKAGNLVLQSSANIAEVQARTSIIMSSLALGL